ANVRVDHQIDVEAGIAHADIHARTLEHQPAHAQLHAARGNAAELEADDHARLGQPRDVDAPVHRPHEQRRIEVLSRELPRGVALTPLPEALDDLAELLPRRGQAILAAAAASERRADDNPGVLQL